jgi:hypothetical protein
VVFKGRLPQLYSPEGMNCYRAANHVRYLDFKTHAKEVTRQVMAARLVESAKAAGRFQYWGSSPLSKEEAARAILKRCRVSQGLVAVLQCVEPCWTLGTKSVAGRLKIVGEMGKCSSLYHYYLHPRFGWMYMRFETWFPFEVQIGSSGREWLAQRMDQEGMRYQRKGNKFLWVEDWQQARALAGRATTHQLGAGVRGVVAANPSTASGSLGASAGAVQLLGPPCPFPRKFPRMRI